MTTAATTTTSRLLDGKRVVIVGAGPSGLTLARLLQMNGAAVQVFELDASAQARDQGGDLDLHEDSGQPAMRKAGLMDRFLALSRPDAQSSRVYDKHGAIHVDLGAKQEQTTRPEIDRGVLRDLLLDSLAPHTVTWGRQLDRIERTDGGRFRLRFQGGAAADADLLFGCDGTWSKVRPLVSSTRPHYAGITLIESRVSAIDRRYSDIASLVGPGTIMATGDNRALMAQRTGDGNARIYVVLRVPEDWARTCGLDFEKPAQARAGLLTFYQGWAPRVSALLRETDDIFIPRPLYTLPPEQTWHAQPDVTLLGDAAHVMPPWTGKGANFAMLDAVEVADQLTSDHVPDVPTALRAYEQGMLTRMSRAIAQTLADQDVMIAANAPEGFAALFQKRIQAAKAAAERTA
jgi:2-polyprenyl-6-methoxyphenol hydroxylase-like FAD-dependent oxidoreductase